MSARPAPCLTLNSEPVATGSLGKTQLTVYWFSRCGDSDIECYGNNPVATARGSDIECYATTRSLPLAVLTLSVTQQPGRYRPGFLHLVLRQQPGRYRSRF